MADERGLLIVNADDWGYSEETTQAIADCHSAGGVTSTTAMQFMRGSEAAAALAREHPKLGIGLHLNLLEAYSDPSTPREVRNRQHRLLSHFNRMRLRRWLYDPRLQENIDAVIADQLECFLQLYGRPPTHVDGHHHCHLAANVLLSSALPRGTKIRSALSDAHHANPITNALRSTRRRAITRRFPSPRFFFSIETFWPRLRGAPPNDKLALARTSSVEVMVHPKFPSEYEPLQSADWIATLRALPAGTFADLPGLGTQ